MRPCKRSGTERSFSPPNLVDCQTVITLPLPHSAVQRRPPASYGNSGQGETLQAQPKRLTARPMESGWPQRNGTPLLPSKPNQKADCQTVITLPLPHSAVQRRPPASYGNSGQGETL
ncbi:hypothetical protein ACM6N5_19145 [Rossellomorea marisflavi]|uniref:hypothetical protein n=1 Tax=Rossellomorea marisflavi TaxID=189381 RepID=UPI003ADCF1CB